MRNYPLAEPSGKTQEGDEQVKIAIFQMSMSSISSDGCISTA